MIALVADAGDKIIALGSSMRNHPCKISIVVENNPIRTWTSTIIVLEVTQNGKLIVRSGYRKLKALIIPIYVRIIPRALGLPGEM
jgi:hypothetical protein